MSLSLFPLILLNGPIVDKFRLSLEAHSAFWFRLVKYSGYAVAFGCVLEAPETFVTIKRWWLLRFRGVEHEETGNDKRSWFIPIAAAGLIIIVLGIVAETYFEGKVSDVDSDIRTYESDKITAAEGDAAAAIRDAGTAKSSAIEAAGASKTARGASSAAFVVASGARKEADSLTREIDAANRKAADAVSRLAQAEQRLADATQSEARAEAALRAIKTPRSIISPQKVVSELKPFSGTEYELSSFQDDESIQLTKMIATMLHDAGWVLKQPQQIPLNALFFPLLDKGPKMGVPLCIRTGISIDLHVDNPNAVIGKTLETAPKEAKAGIVLDETLASNISPMDVKNVDPRILDPAPGKAPVSICVGKKP